MQNTRQLRSRRILQDQNLNLGRSSSFSIQPKQRCQGAYIVLKYELISDDHWVVIIQHPNAEFSMN